VGKTGQTRGAHASAVDREKTPKTEGVNQKEKAYLCHYTNGARGLSGLGRPVGFDLRERREASGVGWANGRVGRKVGQAESEEKNF
jgi:hypothetical protein